MVLAAMETAPMRLTYGNDALAPIADKTAQATEETIRWCASSISADYATVDGVA